MRGLLFLGMLGIAGCMGTRGDSTDSPSWRDGSGQLIGKVLPDGTLLIHSRDKAGRIHRTDCRDGYYPRETSEIPTWGTLLWTHVFLYDTEGRLVREADCRGLIHSYRATAGSRVHPSTGSALSGHDHIGSPSLRFQARSAP